MSAREAFDLLWLASWTGSLTMLLVLALRVPLRRRFGAGIAYAAWALVPATWLALLLPARVVAVPAMVAAIALPAQMDAVAAPARAAFDWAPPVVALWLAGALAMAAWLAWQQHRFVRGLGALQVLDAQAGVLRAQACEGLPALVGLLQPRIVMPADVEARYGEDERALMLAHERVHLHRGDAWANALVALLRCLQWFNPLAHLAASRLRHDQELACDERVVAGHPQSRRAYADAMLKTLVATQPVPLGCHWGITHPMKERIMMLRQDRPARRTRLVGAVLIGVAAMATGFAAWSAQPARVVRSEIDTRVTATGAGIVGDIALGQDGLPPIVLQLETGPGKPFSIRNDRDGSIVMIEGTIDAVEHMGQPAYKTSVTIRRDGVVVGTPTVIALAGKPAQVRMGKEAQDGTFEGIDLSLTMSAGSLRDGLKVPEGAASGLDATNLRTKTVVRTQRLPADAAHGVPLPPLPPAPPTVAADGQATVVPESRLGSSVRYPTDALKRGESGEVVLEVDVDAQGRATDVRVVSSTPPGVFDQASIDAARQWKYNPRIENGKAVAGTVRVPMAFQADPPAPPTPPAPPAAGPAPVPPPPPALPDGTDVQALLASLPPGAEVKRVERRTTRVVTDTDGSVALPRGEGVPKFEGDFRKSGENRYSCDGTMTFIKETNVFTCTARKDSTE